MIYFIAPMTNALQDIIAELFPDLNSLNQAFINFVPVIPFILIAIGVFIILRGNTQIKG